MSPDQQSQSDRYRNAWAAIVQLVREGHSWSGRERNHLFLNRGGDSFTDVSAVTGLDHSGDGRAFAAIDWDQDGDLDLWYRDRTAPRLRLMLNQYADPDTQDYVAVKLEGATCNRDAIGAVVEVVAGDAAERFVQSVQAGNLFLSQASRWLHFGLGSAHTIREIRVRWPGTERWESFSGACPGGRYHLRQGTGAADLLDLPSRELSSAPDAAPTEDDRNVRIILPARIPLPPLTFRDPAGQPQMLANSEQPRLVLIWSAECPHCRRDLATIAGQATALQHAGLDVVALAGNVGAGAPSITYDVIDQSGWPFAWGTLERESLTRIDAFQRALFDVTVPLNVPLAFLCDRDGSVLAIYRGAVDAERVLADLVTLIDAEEQELHTLAPPFGGRWFTKPVDPVFAVEFMARQFETRLPEDSLFYLDHARSRAGGEDRTRLTRELVVKHHALGRQYKAQRFPERAAAHFESALALESRAAIYLDYGTMVASYGQLDRAQELLEEALAIEPDLQPAQEALRLVRKFIAEGR